MSDDHRFLFGKEKILALPIPEAGQRVVYHDTKAVGLQIRITSTGTKTFSVYRRLKAGDPERITLGKFPAMTVEQARKIAAEVNATIESGANPAETKRALKAEKTLSELFVEYGTRHGERKRAWKDDQQRFRDYLQKPLGNHKLSTITRQMISQVLSNAEKAGKSTATIRNIRALASGLFGKAVEWGFLESNPATGLKVSGEKVERDRFLQSEELPRFFTALDEEPSDTGRDYILMALLTGARRANLCEMRWQDIRFDDAAWTIGRTKNGKPQNVTLSPEAVLILQARKEAAERNKVMTKTSEMTKSEMDAAALRASFVFPGTGETGHYAEPRKAVERVMKRANIPFGRNVEDGITLHDLRRTLGSWQAKTGASLVVIGKSLNHKSTSTTAIYARLDLDPVRQSVNTATAAMLEAGGIKPAAQVVPMNKQKRSTTA